MNGLKGIPITVVDSDTSGVLSGNAEPLLYEIESLLNDLVESGKSSIIDLLGLPLVPGDYEKLKEILGQGEVNATLDAMGPTYVRETAVHGVWWVTHHNSDNVIVADFIEVTYIPEILRTHPVDARMGLDILRSRLTRTTETDKGDADVRQ
ncbi:MAG: hydrogenase expression/formation C-terminal domain-containing protein [Sulfuricaulis sp.]